MIGPSDNQVEFEETILLLNICKSLLSWSRVFVTKVLQTYMSLGGGGFKVSPPPMKLLLYPKDYLPPIHWKNGIFEEMFDFFDEKMPFLGGGRVAFKENFIGGEGIL